MIKLYDLARQNRKLSSDFARVLSEVIEQSAFILRDDVKDLESSVKNFLNEDVEVIGVNSGTDGLILGLFGAGLKPGDEVIVPSRTYIASVAAIVHLKLVPRFVDIGDDLNLDVDLIESQISELTKAIMPVHLSGHACDMESISRIAIKYNLKVIEDAAPSFGSKFKGQNVGTFGEIGVFSLHPLKVFGVLGDGGLMIVKSRDADFIRTFRDHGHPQPKSDENFISFGVNSRLDNLQAGFAKVKLRNLNDWIDRRRKIAEYYSLTLLDSRVGDQVRRYLDNLKKDSIFFDTFSAYVLSVDNPLGFSDFMLKLHFGDKDLPVETARDFPRPINSHPNLRRELPTDAQRFLERTHYFAQKTMKIPIYPELEDSEVELIAKKLRRYFDSLPE